MIGAGVTTGAGGAAGAIAVGVAVDSAFWGAWQALHPSKPKTSAALAMQYSNVKKRKNPDINGDCGGVRSSVE